MRVLQRTIVLAALLALGVALFYVGREHQIFLDNKTIEADGKTFRAMEQVNVSVNGGNPVELLARDRDVVKAVGPSFSLRVEVLDSMGGDVERTIELKMTPGFGKDMMLSLPLLAAGREDFLLPPPEVQVSAQSEPATPGGGEAVPGSDGAASGGTEPQPLGNP